MNPLNSFISFILIFFVFSCNSPEPDLTLDPAQQEVNSAKTNDQAWMSLRYQKPQKIQDTDWSLNFSGLKEDSRCPADAVCIRMGVVRVELTLTDSNKELYSFELGLGEDLPAINVYGGYQFELQKVSPYPMGGDKIPAAYYQAEIVVTEVQ